MENIGEVVGDERIPSWLKVIIIILIILAAIVGIIVALSKAYNNIKSTPKGNKKESDQVMPNDALSIIDENEDNLAFTELEKNYTSIFAEDNRIKTEQISITKQHNGTIEGTVTLIDKDINGSAFCNFTYLLKGRFTNNILTAEYYSSDDNADERGAINLKLIDRKMLSGFCSFSKLSTFADDEIRVSPYVWVAGENQDLLNGTFEFCTKCHEEQKVCCCASEKIDMPVFLNSEIELIRNNLSNKAQEKNTFSKTLPDPFQKSHVRQMKREEKKTNNGDLLYTKCYFYDIEEKRCKIYQGRPIDCRLFPFDIKLTEDKQEYVIGYYTELCERNLPSFSIMKKKAHLLRPYFFLLYPYLHLITNKNVCQKLQNADFQEIGKFKDFVF